MPQGQLRGDEPGGEMKSEIVHEFNIWKNPEANYIELKLRDSFEKAGKQLTLLKWIIFWRDLESKTLIRTGKHLNREFCDREWYRTIVHKGIESLFRVENIR
jgi:hypothetical protein